eukprot:2124321-Rhodomonas_salina.1
MEARMFCRDPKVDNRMSNTPTKEKERLGVSEGGVSKESAVEESRGTRSKVSWSEDALGVTLPVALDSGLRDEHALPLAPGRNQAHRELA